MVAESEPWGTESMLDAALEDVLIAIEKAHDIRAGLVYYWDAARTRLVCRAGRANGKRLDHDAFWFEPSKPSFALWVKEEANRQVPGLFVVDPVDHPQVDQERRRQFGIEGP